MELQLQLQTRLTNNAASDSFPSFSPDGTNIAFASQRDGNDEIYIMDADGSNQTRLTNNAATDYYPSFGRIATQVISEETAESIWVRNVQMTCYQVWINEDNNFEFVFWWEYKNNNWVKIYDMEGSEVFSIDMKKGNARFEADLPDGFYTVKTFHDGFETPIQEFLIGKP